MMDVQKRNRLFIIIIFVMSALPVFLAFIFQHTPDLLKRGTNNGQLITPPITTTANDFIGFDGFSNDNLKELSGHWVLLNIMPTEHCNAVCLDALIKIKQLRLMLNKEFPRTRRAVLLFNEVNPSNAEQWWLKDALLTRLLQSKQPAEQTLFTQLLNEEHALDEAKIKQLIGNEDRETALKSDLIKIKPSENLRSQLLKLRANQIPDGMLLLIDPLGNIMMQYESGFDPYKVKNDLMHLLKASQIG